MKLVIGWCVGHGENTIFGVGFITLEILQIEAYFIVILQCEFTYLRKSYKEKNTFELYLVQWW
jgi:hypothetical protein